MSKNVSVIVVNYNGKQDTLACLESMEKWPKSACHWQTIVVDNASSDGSAAVIKKCFPKAQLVESHKNLGFVGGNNVGIRLALQSGSDFLVILNNDTLADKNLLAELISGFRSKSKVGLVVPKIYFAKGHEFHQGRYQDQERGKVVWYAGGDIDWNNMFAVHFGVDEVDVGQFSAVKEVEFATGCCFMAKRQVFEKVGLFDSKFFLYGEDVDFSVRVRKAGFKIVYRPSAILWHKNSGSSHAGSELQDYFIFRNRLLLGWRWAPARTKLALFRESLRRMVFGRRWEKIGIRDFYLGRFGQGSYPLDGRHKP